MLTPFAGDYDRFVIPAYVLDCLFQLGLGFFESQYLDSLMPLCTIISCCKIYAITG